MAIAATGGTAGNNSGSVTSLALSSYTTHSGQDVYFCIALGSTSSSVTSISNSAGSYSGVAVIAAQNGTGVRTELWKAHVTTGAATVFTINLTPATSIAAALEEYSGVSALGNNTTGSGSDTYPRREVLDQDGNNWVVAALGFACVSGDTQTAQCGTSRQASIPAATAVAIALYDNTMVAVGTLVNMTRLSNSRNWASVGSELRFGASAVTAVDYAATAAPAAQQAQDVRYLRDLEPIFVTNWSPPSGGGPNWGFTA